MSTTPTETGCCPRFDPDPWQGRDVIWDNKPFVRDRVHSVLHIPLDFGRVMARNTAAIEAGGACDADQLVLCNENSLWGTDVFIAVQEPIAGLETTTISGRFLATVHEGSFRSMKTFRDDAVAQAAAQGFDDDQVYFWYTTCPKCAKAYGKNYIVIFVGSQTRSE